MRTYVAPGSAGELLARAEVEAGTSSSDALRSNGAALATVFPLWARATDAFYDGLFEEALGRVPVGAAGDDVAAGRVTVERSAGDPDHATDTAREPSDREQFGNADVELRQGSS